MKGISKNQLVFLAVIAFGIAASAVSVLLEAWRIAALAALGSFGLFVLFVAFSLAAMTRSSQLVRSRVREIYSLTKMVHASTRRVDNRTAERFKTLESTQDRIEAAERRLLATLESQRFQLEDDIARLADGTQASSR
ncbi:hypothetical protein [Nesterenkonia pannonica]|uniref:hypothetical protein n=1 Tax=Nesterenkonia pannonica TaxID=1548602 RepID=UPI0021644085|nr:hypothetical protein [Nesterenkonia pannonica]